MGKDKLNTLIQVFAINNWFEKGIWKMKVETKGRNYSQLPLINSLEQRLGMFISYERAKALNWDSCTLSHSLKPCLHQNLCDCTNDVVICMQWT